MQQHVCVGLLTLIVTKLATVWQLCSLFELAFEKNMHRNVSGLLGLWLTVQMKSLDKNL